MDYNTLDDLAVTGKRVLVRADLNVPLKDGVVTDATRIARQAPTIRDLAAKGAEPVHYLLNLTLPHAKDDWLARFAAGLARDQEEFGISLLGGDTGVGPLSIAITAFGFVPQGQMVKRDGARIGDAVYVTGAIGDSGGGLAILGNEKHGLNDTDRDGLIARYRIPVPPVMFAAPLRAIAHAAIDVSDGLIADLGHVASASDVRIVVEGERVPLSAPLRALWGQDALLRAVGAGDDYQIAFTAPPGLSGPFTEIGRVLAGKGVKLVLGHREVAVPNPGYRHF